jgi:Domain of unknown function (DUF4391)
MFAYPKQAELNRVVPKNKIYAHTQPSKRIKELFVAQVGEILWKYKLSPETINLPARNGINEIQVFEIVLKTPELDEAVLQSMDKAIPFPILFQVIYGEHIRFAVSYKRPSDADSSKWVIEATFQTEPQSLNAERPPLPVALDLAGLYEQIVRRFIPLSPRPGEGIREHIARLIAIEVREKERQQLEVRLDKEKQFNRKVELNAALRSLSREIESLKQF